MASLRSLVASLALLALAQSSLATAFEPAATIGRDQAVSYSVNATSRDPWQQTITVAGAKFLTVHFSQFSLAPGDVVTVSDATGAVVAEYTGLGRGDLGDKGGFYSTQVFSSSVVVQFKPSPVSPPSGQYGFVIDKVVRSSSSASVSSICGANQMEPVKCYLNDPRMSGAYTKSQAVARLTITGGKTCTGWLVGSEGHMLTNYHCISSQNEASNTQYEFGAESPTCDDQCLTSGSCRGTIAATTATFVAGDATLDYALVKLNATVDLSSYGFLTLRIAGGVDQEQIYIPQHPGGRAKVLAVVVDSGNVALATMGVSDTCGSYRVGYDADTEPGSSGSPVLAAKDNQVIALHSCGTSDTKNCTNSGLDVRTLITDLRAKNVVPEGAIDDPTASIPAGPWLPSTPAPTTAGPVTPAPTLDICPGFKSQNSCAVFTQGRCLWVNGTCVKNPSFSPSPPPATPAPTQTTAAPTPALTTPAPTTPAPTTPSPTSPAPTTPAPTTPAPTTPAPTTPAPTTPAPTTPEPAIPAPTTPAPTTPAPTTPAPTNPAPTAPAPTTPVPTTPVPTTLVPATPTPTTPAPTTPQPTKASVLDKICKPFPQWFCFGVCKWSSEQGQCRGVVYKQHY